MGRLKEAGGVDACAAALAKQAAAEAGSVDPEETGRIKRLAALLATQAEEEMPAPAKVAPEPEAEPQAEAWYGEQEPTVEGVVVETEPER